MKKSNILIIIIFIIVLGVGIYITYDNNSNNDIDINFNEDEELTKVNDLLSEIGAPLGWLIIVNGIENQNDEGIYELQRNTNLLKDIKSKQLLTMEYILSYQNKHSDFIVLEVPSNKITNSSPTEDFTLAYLKYDDFNAYYKDLFGEDFNNSKAKKGNTEYDKDYVYYENRRAGSNGVYVPMMNATDVSYNNEYIAKIEITYSSKASNLIGKEQDTGTLAYTKDINNNIILKEFKLDK